MYSQSAESGIDTDQEVKEKLQFVHVFPDKIKYDSKQKIALVFNKSLPSKGSFRADFRGSKRSVMQVAACRINPCTLLVEAPVYYPAEQVYVIARHITHEGCCSLGRLPFEFLPRDAVLAGVLQDFAGCPVTFMCESLGISPADIHNLDSALAVTFRSNMPQGFNLIALHNNNILEEPSLSHYPTLLHFAAAFGLNRLTNDCLLDCPGAKEASLQRNCNGLSPEEIARQAEFYELAESILNFQARCGDNIYETMENPEDNGPSYSEDPGYTQMRPGYINIQLWGPDAASDGYVESDQPEEECQEQEFYIDMTRCDEEAEDGYVLTGEEQKEEYYGNCCQEGGETCMPEGEGGEELYIDMNEDNELEAHYTYVEESPVGEGELYEDLSGNQAVESVETNETGWYLPRVPAGQNSVYDTPSNLPVDRFPASRSASMSGPAHRPDVKTDKSSTAAALYSTSGVENAPAVPKRTSRNQHHRLQRTGSTGSKISSTSTISGSSAASAGSEGYQADVDVSKEDEEELMMDREQLLQSLNKVEITELLPPLPPADYGSGSSSLAPPVSPHLPSGLQTSAQQPSTRKKHARSSTEPIKVADVQNVKEKMTPRTSSLRKTRPPVPSRTASEQQMKVFMRPSRGRSYSEEEEIGRRTTRPPAPAPPESRPPAPVPKEPSELARGDECRRRSLGQVPTPFTSALAAGILTRRSDEDLVPPPPPRNMARAQPPAAMARTQPPATMARTQPPATMARTQPPAPTARPHLPAPSGTTQPPAPAPRSRVVPRR